MLLPLHKELIHSGQGSICHTPISVQWLVLGDNGSGDNKKRSFCMIVNTAHNLTQ